VDTGQHHRAQHTKSQCIRPAAARQKSDSLLYTKLTPKRLVVGIIHDRYRSSSMDVLLRYPWMESSQIYKCRVSPALPHSLEHLIELPAGPSFGESECGVVLKSSAGVYFYIFHHPPSQNPISATPPPFPFIKYKSIIPGEGVYPKFSGRLRAPYFCQPLRRVLRMWVFSCVVCV